MFFDIFKSRRKLKLPDRDLNEIKQLSKILFIDDKTFPVVDILKDASWVNTKRIKDAESLDQMEIKEAHILFVDIQGIGKKLKFKDEGLGLVIALKEKYPNKKYFLPPVCIFHHQSLLSLQVYGPPPHHQ